MYKLKYFLYYELLNKIYKFFLARSNNFIISPNAKVNYLGIRNNKNSLLKIGQRSLVEGSVVFERENASVFIGENTNVGRSNIICADKIEIGNDVLIAWGCTILDNDSHSLSEKNRRKDASDWYNGKKDWSNVSMRPIKIEDSVWIGFNSIILKGVTIGKGAVIGAGSVVTRDVKPFTVVAGNPAKFIKDIKNE